ncbi:MAG: replication initiator protein A [Clostridia bacterium]|nr:replication initiator protein A [Clostridia bacterium]
MNEYFTEQTALDYAFYRVPKALIVDPAYRDTPTEAKLLYGLLLDRLGLSLRNGWLDDRGRVFLYYTVANIREDLNCSKEKACKLLRELERIDLIERKRQGLGLPTRIYVKRFSQRSENPTSGGRNIRL